MNAQELFKHSVLRDHTRNPIRMNDVFCPGWVKDNSVPAHAGMDYNKDKVDDMVLVEDRRGTETPMTDAKPDFSGEWILNREGSTLSPGADGVQSGVWRIDHREPTFHHKASFVTETDPIEYQYELQSDGREVVSAHEDTRTVSSLRWEGSALVVTFRTQHSHGEMAVSFRYELLDAGERLRAAEQLRGTDHDQDNIWIFERRGQVAQDRPTELP